ncbi:uncharacterized protein CEXT_379681 [Caerostris extrusa]|uniref:Gustatory receptor n=1 Tax=Caerostris extrusa TaxID=172846 RepID=A0AAV4V5Q5_CAEEX|nr:uncharacterized protein CEXT_379681 [Caerostris extrusa]
MKFKNFLSQKTDPNNKILHDLSPSIHMILLLGIFPRDKSTSKKDSLLRRFFCRTVENLIHAFWLYVFVVGSLVVSPLTRHLQTNFTLSLMNMIIAIVHFVLHLKRHKVYSVIRTIEKFYTSATTDAYQPMRNRLIALICGCLLLCFVMIITSLEHLKVAGVLEDYTKDFVFGMNTTKEDCKFFDIFPMLFVTTTVIYHHLSPISVSIFICSIHLTFKKSVAKFGERIEKDRLSKCTNIDIYISLYNRMVDVLGEVEDLLSASTFFLYGGLITNQLCVLTQVIANGGILTHPASIMMESMLTVKNFVIFFSITLIGSSVTQETNKVAREIKCLTVESSHDFEKLSILLQNVCSTSASLTAWQMFSLKKNLILTTASVMVSYGMLLVQFSNQTNNL